MNTDVSVADPDHPGKVINGKMDCSVEILSSERVWCPFIPCECKKIEARDAIEQESIYLKWARDRMQRTGTSKVIIIILITMIIFLFRQN